jgi:hypothetical protein
MVPLMASEGEVRDFLNSINTTLPDDMMRLCRGKIISYDSTAKTATVTLSGGSVECPGTNHFDHYTPVAGDDVYIVIVAENKMVFGKIRRP